MPTIISKSKFKPAALEYFRQVQETQEELIIISDHGKPVLKIVPYHDPAHAKTDPISVLRGTLRRYEQPFDSIAEVWDSAK